MDIRTVTEGLRFPEGPVACADGSVILVEIAAGALTRVAPDGAKSTVARPGGGPNGAAIGPDGRGYVVNNGGFEWLVDDGGDAARPSRPAITARRGGSNASTSRPARSRCCTASLAGTPCAGRTIWRATRRAAFGFTTIWASGGRATWMVGGVDMAKRDGSGIVEVAHPLVTPNGIGLSPDGKTLYVAETEAARLWAFDIVEPGVVRKDPWPSPHGGRIVAGMGGYQRFDSLAVQEDGRIAVATLINGGITVISPDGLCRTTSTKRCSDPDDDQYLLRRPDREPRSSRCHGPGSWSRSSGRARG